MYFTYVYYIMFYTRFLYIYFTRSKCQPYDFQLVTVAFSLKTVKQKDSFEYIYDIRFLNCWGKNFKICTNSIATLNNWNVRIKHLNQSRSIFKHRLNIFEFSSFCMQLILCTAVHFFQLLPTKINLSLRIKKCFLNLD